MSKDSILIVVPTFGHFDYAARAIKSAIENTQALEPFVYMIDDASPSLAGFALQNPVTWPEDYKKLRQFTDTQKEKVLSQYFSKNGGLTRSWNSGLEAARHLEAKYCCVTNSDVVFPKRWEEAIVNGLERYDLVGPLTNAPGTENQQYIGSYSRRYQRDDSNENINAVAEEVCEVQRGRCILHDINGFCMIAKTETWWSGAFDETHVFNPVNKYNSKGAINPTPLMTLQEYELQRRWRAMNRTSAICVGSYVFHYRAVSRGDAFKRGDWVRAKEG